MCMRQGCICGHQHIASAPYGLGGASKQAAAGNGTVTCRVAAGSGGKGGGGTALPLRCTGAAPI